MSPNEEKFDQPDMTAENEVFRSAEIQRALPEHSSINTLSLEGLQGFELSPKERAMLIEAVEAGGGRVFDAPVNPIYNAIRDRGPNRGGGNDPEEGGERDDQEQGQGGATERRKKSKTPALDSFCTDLTGKAERGEIDPVIGRENEIERAIEILSRRTKNNPVFIGEAGVGKTAIAEGLAQRIVDGMVPENLQGKRVMMLDLAGMVAGTKYRGQFEERLQALMKEVRQQKNVIMFIDELHTLVSAGGAEGAMNAGNTLKPALARGEFQCMGATTLDEYRKYVEKDAALARRFQPVVVEPPSVPEAIDIMKGLAPKYEKHHKCSFTEDALVAAVKLSERYIHGRHLPDKAIDVIDEAGARARLLASRKPANLDDLKDKIDSLFNERREALGRKDFEEAQRLRTEEKKLRAQLDHLSVEWKRKSEGSQPLVVGAEEIKEVLSQMTGIPLGKVSQNQAKEILSLGSDLKKEVIGQELACDTLASAVIRDRAGLRDPNRPLVYAFTGPTGVGKTLLAKKLAGKLFGDENALVQIDMSEYMEKHNASRLLGAPPGYVGYEEGGQLTEKIRRRPYCVVLLDEIEKAHPDVWNTMLQAFEEGRLTDGLGRKIPLKNVIFIMTSNVGGSTGGEQIGGNFGFGAIAAQRNPEREDVKRDKAKAYVAAFEAAFRPEFVNRIDKVIPFNSLVKADQAKILELELKAVYGRVEAKKMELVVTEEAKELILKKGFDIAYGARPLKRAIENLIEDVLADEILRSGSKPGIKFVAKVAGDKLDFEIIHPDAPKPVPAKETAAVTH